MKSTNLSDLLNLAHLYKFSRNHDLVINGGTPFEKGIPLDPNLNVNGINIF